MNAKRFRVIFSRALRQPVVVSEVKSHRGKAASSHRQGSAPAKFPFLQPTRLVASVLLALCAMTSVKSFAQSNLPSPSLNTVNAAAIGMGSAGITTNGQEMTITQGAGNAVINWNSFDIAKDHSVTFTHKNITDATLNRISGAQSKIDGLLKANGRVFLLNPNGVVFGSSAQVEVGGLVVSTQAIGDTDFMTGNYAFSPAAGVTTVGEIINNGTIQADGLGGFVVLAGAGNVTNTGRITATNGTVQMAQGKDFKLTMPSTTNPFLSLELTGTAVANNNIGVYNERGTIKAANVELKAKEGWVRSVSGDIEAKAIKDLVSIDNKVNDRNGSVNLAADNGSASLFGLLNGTSTIKADKDMTMIGGG